MARHVLCDIKARVEPGRFWVKISTGTVLGMDLGGQLLVYAAEQSQEVGVLREVIAHWSGPFLVGK
ncbi:MAG: hypothetical protein ACYDEV_07015 [Acidiferrobacter sp.]